jgi:hypothetical protein
VLINPSREIINISMNISNVSPKIINVSPAHLIPETDFSYEIGFLHEFALYRVGLTVYNHLNE